MDVSTRPDPARLTGIWSQGSVPTADLQLLEGFTDTTLDQVLDILQQDKPDAAAAKAAMDNLKALHDITGASNPELPANRPTSRTYAGQEEIGSPSGFRWIMRSYYDNVSYHWQEGDRFSTDVSTVKGGLDKLVPQAEQSLAAPGPLSGEKAQPVITDLIKSLKTSVHDLQVFGTQVNQGGLHEVGSSYRDWEDQDLQQNG